jgi:CHASE3 domain sensor protein
MGFTDKIKEKIEAQAEVIGSQATEKMFMQFRNTFNDMSKMISDTQDNQIEMNEKIELINKKLYDLHLLIFNLVNKPENEKKQ